MFKRDEDLISEYRKSLKQLNASLRVITDKRCEVSEGGKTKIVDCRTDTEKEDQKKISAMISDCRYVLYWLEHGHERPIENNVNRLSRQKREKLWADIDQAAYYYGVSAGSLDPNRLNQKKVDQSEQLKVVLSLLSKRELEFFRWRHEVMMTEVEAAKAMDVKPGTAKSMANRIRKKIESYFLSIDQKETEECNDERDGV